MPVSEARLRRMAKERVKFKDHFYAYILINFFFLVLNIVASPQTWWFWWLTLIWGFFVLMHWYKTYITDDIALEEAEYKKLKEEQKQKAK